MNLSLKLEHVPRKMISRPPRAVHAKSDKSALRFQLAVPARTQLGMIELLCALRRRLVRVKRLDDLGFQYAIDVSARDRADQFVGNGAVAADHKGFRHAI